MSDDNNDDDININKQKIQAVPFSTGDSDVWEHILRVGSGW